MLTTIGAKLLVAGVLVAVILLAIVAVQNRMGCTTPRQEARAERREWRSQRIEERGVVSVASGSALIVVWGRGGRQNRTVVLDGLEVPSAIADASKANLSRLVGNGERVIIHYEAHGLFCGGAGETGGDAVESAGPIAAVVYGPGGSCLNTEQLCAGMAKCAPGAGDVFLAAEKVAKRKQVGIWSVK